MMIRQAANTAIIKEGKRADENARVVREATNAKIIQQARTANTAEENILVQNAASKNLKDQNMMIQSAAAVDLKKQNIQIVKQASNAKVTEVPELQKKPKKILVFR